MAEDTPPDQTVGNVGQASACVPHPDGRPACAEARPLFSTAPFAWESRGALPATDFETEDGQRARCRAGSLRALAGRLIVGLFIGASILFVLREVYLQTGDHAVCERALRAHDWKRLRQAATKWLNRSSRSGDAWMYLALAAENQGDLEWATTALARVPDNHPRVAAALHRHLALTTRETSRPLEASGTLERLLQVDPQNPAVHRQAITFYAQTFQHARLVEQVRSSISLQCEPPEAYLYLATADGGRVSAPAELHQRWVATYPDCPLFAVAQTLSMSCEAHGGLPEAGPGESSPRGVSEHTARLDAALARFPDNAELLAFHIEQAMARENAADVCRLLDRASARMREDDRFWRYGAWRHAALNEPREAEAACRQAQKLQPLSWKTKRLLATLLRNAGRPDEAPPLERLADEGEAIHVVVGRLEDPSVPPAELLRRIAAYAAACDDELVARGIQRHLQ